MSYLKIIIELNFSIIIQQLQQFLAVSNNNKVCFNQTSAKQKV